MVAAAMLVAMSVPAFAQNDPQLVPGDPENEGNFDLNVALSEIEQDCEQELEDVEQENEAVVIQPIDQNQEGVEQRGAVGIIVLGSDTHNTNFGDVEQEQEAENEAEVDQRNIVAQSQECNAAIANLQDLFDLFLGDRNGPPPTKNGDD